MKTSARIAMFLVTAMVGLASLPSEAQDASRKELRREDLSGAPGMEVILSITELKPGDEIPEHVRRTSHERASVTSRKPTETPGSPDRRWDGPSHNRTPGP